MKNLSFIYILLLILFINHKNFAQNHVLKGVVLEETALEKFTPIVGASVFWLGTTLGTSTDTAGVFSIVHRSDLKRLVVSFVGMKSDTINVLTMNTLRIVLKPNKTLEEVEVKGERAATYIDTKSAFKTQVMTEKELLKAACCNLSESFETNPSVDVSMADGVTGARQIQMLGLSGIYTQITSENLPSVRGLAANYGLLYTPGTYVESIQITKGAGSVANGFESIAGQINVEMKKPNSEKFYFNAYGNNMGRVEANINMARPVGKNWGTALLLHTNLMGGKIDMNDDGFKDIPTGFQLNAVSRWHFATQKGWAGQFGIKLMKDERLGGQTNFTEADKLTSRTYGVGINTERVEGFAKFGYLFPKQKYKSFGVQASVLNHKQNSYFGFNSYDAVQRGTYLNIIYQSIIGSTFHKFRTGVSHQLDDFDELVNSQQYRRTESVLGAFFEYTYEPTRRLTVVTGLRADYHNLFGVFLTPRLHAKYDLTPTATFRLSAGRGQRTANIFAENAAIFVSSRRWNIYNNGNTGKAYGLNPEVAWNYGAMLTQNFTLADRLGSINVEYFYTNFENQVVADLDSSPDWVLFYNLDGKSYSHSFQVEMNYELATRFELRLAYRYLDVKTNYHGYLLQRPLIAQDRFFMNLAYKTANNWAFDFTSSWFSRKRIPQKMMMAANDNHDHVIDHSQDEYSPDYVLINAQISKSFKQWDFYVGGENLLGYIQHHLIVEPDKPFGRNFDASLVWGPVVDRMFYAGVRFKIGGMEAPKK